MPFQLSAVANERGAALIVAMMILSLLTILGLSVTGTGLVELDIARNEKVHEIAFYRAESGWQYATSWLEGQPAGLIEDRGSVAAPETWGESFTRAVSDAPEPLPDARGNPSFAVAIDYRGSSHPTLFSSDFRTFDYHIVADGYGPTGAVARIEARLGRLVEQDGY